LRGRAFRSGLGNHWESLGISAQPSGLHRHFADDVSGIRALAEDLVSAAPDVILAHSFELAGLDLRQVEQQVDAQVGRRPIISSGPTPKLI